MRLNSWLDCPTPNPQAQTRLLCIHHAGGSSLLFRNWVESMPPSIEIITAELPGRGRKFGEPLLEDFNIVAEELFRAIAMLEQDKPMAILGHSLGALLAFDLAKKLEGRNFQSPLALFVSGCKSAALFSSEGCSRKSTMSDSELTKALRNHNGTESDLLESEEFLELFLPIFRADYKLVESFRTKLPIEKLRCPLVALGGTEDPDISTFQLLDWQSHTKNKFTHHLFSGDHFFIQSQEAKVMGAVAHELNSLLQ